MRSVHSVSMDDLPRRGGGGPVGTPVSEDPEQVASVPLVRTFIARLGIRELGRCEDPDERLA